MKAEKLRGVDGAELQRQQQDAQEQLFRLRFQMGMGQFEGLKKYRNLKKDRARMLTVLTEKKAQDEEIPEAPAPRKAAPSKGTRTKTAKPKAAKAKASVKTTAAAKPAAKKPAAEKKAKKSK